MEKYTCWTGIVAFDFNPEKDQRQVSGKTVRKFTVNVDGYENACQLDLWPDFETVDLKRGDLVVVGGKAKTWERNLENGETKVTWQMQPYSLAIIESQKAAAPGVQTKTTEVPGVKKKTF